MSGNYLQHQKTVKLDGKNKTHAYCITDSSGNIINDFTGSTGGVELKTADASNRNTLTPDATTSKELFPVQAKRIDVTINNKTSVIAYVRRGAAADFNGEAIQLDPNKRVTINTDGQTINVAFAAVGTGILIGEESYIS